MYDFLRGTVAAIDSARLLSLDVHGVGYALRISEQCRRRLALDGSTVTVFVRLVVREDDLQLFGFSDAAERVAFDLLTSVQQVGSGAAMAVLSAYDVTALRQILLTKDVAALRKVKGIGPKSAERIALELADKVERIPAPLASAAAASTPVAAAIAEAHRALIVLGFSSKEAADALAKVAGHGLTGEQLLRAALAGLR